MKRLPIGIQTFSEIIEDNCFYVDKTEIAYRLASKGKYYFLSRPRRFGKSLFCDTLAEMFKGNKKLFKGLAVYDKWNWEENFPVIRISFGSGGFKDLLDLHREMQRIFAYNNNELGLGAVQNDIEDYRGMLFTIINACYLKYNKKVVIIIDEYDKPVIDNITDREASRINRDTLKNFYSAIKDSDQFIRFVFITGVSKFSKMNLFSGLNNLEDITIDPNYATITGYTHNDIQTIFPEYLEGVDLERVRKWYNGYNYFGAPIYNPFDILLFFSKNGMFRNYWWSTGNPSFLIEKLKEKLLYIPELEQITIGEELLDSFDIEHIDLVALLWHTGYLTFDSLIDYGGKISYKMKIPNLEILYSLNALFFDFLTDLKLFRNTKELPAAKSILEHDFDKMKDVLSALFASIPYSNYANNIIANYEGYYASVVYTFLASIGFEIIAEDITSRGRVDLTIKTQSSIVIIEFKVDSSENALKQIKEKRYFEKYLGNGKDIYLLGIHFDSVKRNVSEFIYEKV